MDAPSTPLDPIRSLWIGAYLPAAQGACIASFLNAGHPFELFTYDHVNGVPPGVRVRAAAEIVPRDRIFTYGPAAGRGQGGLGGFSNLFRYALLLREGGYWADTDTYCLRPFPTDPPTHVIISSERLRDGSTVPNCGVLKCPAGGGHAFAQYCFDRCDRADPDTLVFAKTGPTLIAEAVLSLSLQDSVLPPDAICSVSWFDYLSLIAPGPPPPDAAIGLHLWGECWRRADQDIPWPGPDGSILHALSLSAGAGHPDSAQPPAVAVL